MVAQVVAQRFCPIEVQSGSAIVATIVLISVTRSGADEARA